MARREWDLTGKHGKTNSLSRGRGKGEGSFPWRREIEQQSEMGPGKAQGFRTFQVLQVALYHTLGNLPEPRSAHEFF